MTDTALQGVSPRGRARLRRALRPPGGPPDLGRALGLAGFLLLAILIISAAIWAARWIG